MLPLPALIKTPSLTVICAAKSDPSTLILYSGAIGGVQGATSFSAGSARSNQTGSPILFQIKYTPLNHQGSILPQPQAPMSGIVPVVPKRPSNREKHGLFIIMSLINHHRLPQDIQKALIDRA